MKRVEKHKIKKDNKYFNFLLEQMVNAKHISNMTTFIIRQNFFFNKTKDRDGNLVRKYIGYNKMDKIMKRDKPELYKSLLYIQSTQQILRKVHSNFKSFFKSNKEYQKNPTKYLSRPKLPKYKTSNYDELIITNQNITQLDNCIKFRGQLKDLSFNMSNTGKVQQILFKYNGTSIDVYIIYDNLKEHIVKKEITNIDNINSRVIAIDLGLNNLATITNNIGLQSVIINGKGLKSKNIYYNYKIANCYKDLANITYLNKSNKIYKSNKLSKIRNKRNNIINDYLHKTSRFIINYCKSNKIDTIIIGNNKFQKNNKSKIKFKNLKNFNQIPIKRLIEFLKYKLDSENINLIEIEESYTSKTSFLDNELPIKQDQYLGKRITRGLFKRPCGKLVNADVNSSLQILHKVISIKLFEKLKQMISSNGFVLNPLKFSL